MGLECVLGDEEAYVVCLLEFFFGMECVESSKKVTSKMSENKIERNVSFYVLSSMQYLLRAFFFF